jgi:hypothetical protein
MEHITSPELYESMTRKSIEHKSDMEPKNYSLMFGLGLGFLVLVLVTMLSQIYVMTRYKNMHPLR